MRDVRLILSTLWIFYAFNSAHGDITTLYTSVHLTPVSTIRYTQPFILFGAILVEPAILMVLLSRILQNPANRRANLLVGGLLTAVNVATLFVGTPTLAYAFLTGAMIAAVIAIVWVAWKWVEAAASVSLPAPSRGVTVAGT
jgi:hypothetical protein